MKARVETITPARASYYLDLNIRNRPVSKANVEELTHLMRSGLWKPNGDTIRVSKSGILLDGQHRLLAAEQAKISFEAIIVEDLDDDVFLTIDTGRKRIAADILSIEGNKNAASLAAIARLYIVWKRNGTPFSNGRRAGGRPSHEQIRNVVDTHAFLHEAASLVTSRKFLKKHMRSAYGGLAFCIVAERDIDAAREFFELVAKKEQKESDIVRLLQNRLLEDSSSKTRLASDELLALVLKAFRLWHAKTEVKQLRVRTTGVKKEHDVFIAWPEQRKEAAPAPAPAPAAAVTSYQPQARPAPLLGEELRA
jgi:hypothetical protein